MIKNKLNYKVCVVGGGSWGRKHIRNLHDLGALGGVLDTNPKILDNLAEEYPHIGLYTNLLDALKTGAYAGYIVATPAETHYKIALEIIRSGHHVLVEKPVAMNSKDVYVLKKEAESNYINLMAGHVLLFHPGIQKIKEIIDSGTIGKLQYLYSNRLNLGKIRTEENVFWSLAPHDISIFQYFIGSNPIKINTTGGAFLQDNIHDTTLTVLEYDNNIKGHIFVSWLHPFKEHRLVVVGTNGMISFEDSLENKPLKLFSKSYNSFIDNTITQKEDNGVKLIPFSKEMPLTEELKYFIKHLDGSKLKISNADNAVEVVDILEKASESLMKGQPVE